MATDLFPAFPAQTLEAVAAILGATDTGLTNPQIEAILEERKIRDPRRQAEASDPLVQQRYFYVRMSKRERIQRALQDNQGKTRTGNALIAFVTAAMNPQRYTDTPLEFEERRAQLNEVLAFAGFQVTEGGQMARSERAGTLSEAAKIAGRLHSELERRDTHQDVLKYCTEEVLAKNNFHAALEAVKGIAQRLRELAGIDADGADLVQKALACKSGVPLVFLNPLRTETERGEQTGLMNLVIGLFGMYRNPTAHDAKVVRQAERPITEQELLELFTTLSMVHRRLDAVDAKKRSR